MGKFEYFRELEHRLRGLPERDRQNIIAVYEELFQKAVENGKSEADIAESLGFPRVPNWDAIEKEGHRGLDADRGSAWTADSDAHTGHAQHAAPDAERTYAVPGSGAVDSDPQSPRIRRPSDAPPQAPADPFRDPRSGFIPPLREEDTPPYSGGGDRGFAPPPPPPYRAPSGSGAKPWVAGLALAFFNLVFIVGPFLGLCGTFLGFWVADIALILSPLFVLIGTGFPHDSTSLLLLAFGSLAGFGAGLMLLIVLQWATKWLVKLTVMYIRFNIHIIRGN